MSSSPTPPMDVPPTAAESRPYRRPPGILTAIGVVSIVLATFGLLIGAVDLLQTSLATIFSGSAASSGTVVIVTANVGGAGNGGATSAPATMPAFSLPNYSTLSIVLSLLSDALNLLAAGFLMAIGIMVLRESQRGRTLHLFYAFLKVPLILLAVWAGWRWGKDQSAAFANIPGAATPLTLLLKFSITDGSGFLYPIALLIVLNRPAVRDYYRTLGGIQKARAA